MLVVWGVCFDHNIVNTTTVSQAGPPTIQCHERKELWQSQLNYILVMYKSCVLLALTHNETGFRTKKNQSSLSWFILFQTLNHRCIRNQWNNRCSNSSCEMGGVSSVPQLIGGFATRLLYYLIGANYKTPSLAQNNTILEVWRGRDYHVYDRYG